jgi:hypothetical protein
MDQTDVLTAIGIEIVPPTTPFTLVSAYASGFANTSLSTSTNLLATDLAGGWLQSQPGQDQGVGTTGLNGWFWGNAVNGNYTGPNGGLGSIDYGLVNSTYDTGDGQAKKINDTPLVKDTLTLTVTVGSGFKLSDIQSVRFQYGSDYTNDPHIIVPNENINPIPQETVPEPSSVAMALLGAAPLAIWAQRKRRRNDGAAA